MRFASELEDHINHFSNEPKFENNQDIILEDIGELIKQCALEDYVQNNNSLIDCFIINGGYNYSTTKDIDVYYVIDFYKLLSSHSNNTKKIVIENIVARLKSIPIIKSYDDLPF